jgi:hypothetical protein
VSSWASRLPDYVKNYKVSAQNFYLHQDPTREQPPHSSEGKKAPARTAAEMLAWIISYLMHPLPLPSLMFGLVLVFAPELLLASTPELRWQLMGLLFLTTFAIPAISVFTMHMFGNISSLTMTRREDRRLPFLLVSGFYMLTTYLFYEKFPLLTFVNLGIASITLSLLVLTAVSLYWKMSAHGLAAGGVSGFMAGIMHHFHNSELLYPLAALLLLSGLVLWARLYLGHHTPAEVWVGWFTGFAICLGMVLILYPML